MHGDASQLERMILASLALGVCVLGLADRAGPTDECRFEQQWYAGDVHFNEQIEFRADSTGTWNRGGMAGDAPHDRRELEWHRTASTLTVGDERGRRRAVEYRVERRGATCYLTFEDHPLLDDDSGFRHFADRP